MTTTISPDDYCKHPEDYVNAPGLDNITRAYWDQWCTIKNQADLQPEDPKTFAEKLADGAPEALKSMILGLFDPKFAMVMYPIMFGPSLLKLSGTTLKDLVQKGISKPISEAGIEMVELGIDKMSINVGTVSKLVVDSMSGIDVKAAEETGFSAGSYSIELLLRGFSEALAEGLIKAGTGLAKLIEVADPVMYVMFVLQILGMIFDSWDPCGLNNALSANALQTFSDQFNNVFRETLLLGLDSYQDSYGHTIFGSTWPIQYYAERSALIPHKNDYYDKIHSALIFKYLGSLQYNSQGYQIYKPQNGKLVTNKELQGMSLQLTSFFANGNTIVENWLIKWWPILVGILIIIILFVFVIKNVKK